MLWARLPLPGVQKALYPVENRSAAKQWQSAHGDFSRQPARAAVQADCAVQGLLPKLPGPVRVKWSVVPELANHAAGHL
jgi:hypothetical protein